MGHDVFHVCRGVEEEGEPTHECGDLYHANTPHRFGEVEDRFVDSVDHVTKLGSPLAKTRRALILLDHRAGDPHSDEQDKERQNTQFAELVATNPADNWHAIEVGEACVVRFLIATLYLPMKNPTMLPMWLKRPFHALAVLSCSVGVTSKTRLRSDACSLGSGIVLIVGDSPVKCKV